MVKNPIGDRIRVLRTEKKLSQENVALELGISKSTYSTYETGKTKLTIERLMEIARILDVDVSDIINTEKKKATTSLDPNKQYGFATKSDIEELAYVLKQLKHEIEKLKMETAAAKNPAPKKKKG